MNRRVKKLIVATISVLVVAVLGFFSYEAGKEVYFLCGNFKQGVSYSSVVRQLDTANLSSYTIDDSEPGRKIVLSSPLHFHLFRCNINFNAEELVISTTGGEAWSI